MGKRWEEVRDKGHSDQPGPFVRMMNSHWVRPTAADRPRNAENVEGGCYW